MEFKMFRGKKNDNAWEEKKKKWCLWIVCGVQINKRRTENSKRNLENGNPTKGLGLSISLWSNTQFWFVFFLSILLCIQVVKTFLCAKRYSENVMSLRTESNTLFNTTEWVAGNWSLSEKYKIILHKMSNIDNVFHTSCKWKDKHVSPDCLCRVVRWRVPEWVLFS